MLYLEFAITAPFDRPEVGVSFDGHALHWWSESTQCHVRVVPETSADGKKLRVPGTTRTLGIIQRQLEAVVATETYFMGSLEDAEFCGDKAKIDLCSGVGNCDYCGDTAEKLFGEAICDACYDAHRGM